MWMSTEFAITRVWSLLIKGWETSRYYTVSRMWNILVGILNQQEADFENCFGKQASFNEEKSWNSGINLKVIISGNQV